jgi:tetratricopeptide (TPR) repeat protein
VDGGVRSSSLGQIFLQCSSRKQHCNCSAPAPAHGTDKQDIDDVTSSSIGQVVPNHHNAPCEKRRRVSNSSIGRLQLLTQGRREGDGASESHSHEEEVSGSSGKRQQEQKEGHILAPIIISYSMMEEEEFQQERSSSEGKFLRSSEDKNDERLATQPTTIHTGSSIESDAVQRRKRVLYCTTVGGRASVPRGSHDRRQRRGTSLYYQARPNSNSFFLPLVIPLLITLLIIHSCCLTTTMTQGFFLTSLPPAHTNAGASWPRRQHYYDSKDPPFRCCKLQHQSIMAIKQTQTQLLASQNSARGQSPNKSIKGGQRRKLSAEDNTDTNTNSDNKSNNSNNKSNNMNSKNNKLNMNKSKSKQQRWGNTKRDRIKSMFQKAQQLTKTGQFGRASSMLRHIISDMDPYDAHSYLALGRLESRRELATRSQSQLPLQSVSSQEGDADVTKAATTSAARSWASLLQEDGTNSDSALGSTFLPLLQQQLPAVMDSPTTARETFQTGVDKCPRSIHLWQAWAVHEQSMGRFEKAKKLYEQALQIDSTNPYVCHAFGLMMRQRLGDATKARELWRSALEQHSTAALVCSLGELELSEGHVQVARDIYATHLPRLRSRSSSSSRNGNGNGKNNNKNQRQRRDTERETVEVYLAAAWLEERQWNQILSSAGRGRGRGLELNGAPEKAEHTLQEALYYYPQNSRLLVALARLQARLASGPAGGGRPNTKAFAQGGVPVPSMSMKTGRPNNKHIKESMEMKDSNDGLLDQEEVQLGHELMERTQSPSSSSPSSPSSSTEVDANAMTSLKLAEACERMLVSSVDLRRDAATTNDAESAKDSNMAPEQRAQQQPQQQQQQRSKIMEKQNMDVEDKSRNPPQVPQPVSLKGASNNRNQNQWSTPSSSDGRLYNAWAKLEVKGGRLRNAKRILLEGMQKFPIDHSVSKTLRHISFRRTHSQAQRSRDVFVMGGMHHYQS